MDPNTFTIWVLSILYSRSHLLFLLLLLQYLYRQKDGFPAFLIVLAERFMKRKSILFLFLFCSIGLAYETFRPISQLVDDWIPVWDHWYLRPSCS